VNSRSAFPAARAFLVNAAVLLAGAVTLPASTLFVGFNTQTPVQLYSTGGAYLQDFGPAGAIAAGSYGSGDYFAVTPSSSGSSSSVTEYNNSLAQIGSFTIPNLLTDVGVQGSNLLFSAYDGTVYRTTATGSILNSWSTGFTHVGVTSNGTDIFTTEGDSGNLIDEWSSTGAKIGTITTPFNGLYGLGYDAATGDFWAGSTNFVYQLSGTGTLIASYNLSGDSRTPNGAPHDGLEVGNFSVTPPPPAVPEPASVFLFLAGLAALCFLRLHRRFTRIGLIAGAAAFSCFGSVSVTLTPSVSSGAPVGAPVVWTATAHDSSSSSATFTYQFLEAPSGSALAVKKDWYNSNTFPWTPADSEGLFDIQVNVRSSTGATGVASATFSVSSRVTGGNPVVTATANPLVALYSLPPCPAGHTARVRFKLPSDSVWQATSNKTCTGSTSLNFYVAGMRANNTYQLQQDVYNGPFDTVGPLLTFHTGSVPNGAVPSYTVVQAPTAPNNTAYPITFTGEAVGAPPYAIDSQGQVIWYLARPSVGVGYFTHVLPGGTFLLNTPDYSGRTLALVREYDLAGNIVWETNYAALSQRLVAFGDDPITALHHEAVALPNGWFAVFGSTEKVANQGKGPVDVLGDQVVVFDSNFNVKWYWNEFDHLDITRPAVLGETCTRGNPGCPPITNPNYSVANDWTHSNSIYPTPDGNLIVSIRHQDWVVKIRYQNGSGDGAILWRLGKDGDFTANSSDPYPWNSHQHDAQYAANGLLTLFDNGNTRVAVEGGGNSRGQAWSIDETHHVATPVLNLDLGAYSFAVGSTQLLSNGNYFFDLGYVGGSSTELKEYTTSRALQQQVNFSHVSYRSFRLRSLYAGEQ